MNDIVLIGGGGHCGAVIDVIEMLGTYRIAGIVDVKEKVGTDVRGYKVFAVDDEIDNLVPKFQNFCLTIGHVGFDKLRKAFYLKLKSYGAMLPAIISPRAIVSDSVTIGEGTVVMHGSVINVATTVGLCCIINTGSIVEHDCTVWNHCHLGPGSILTGGCTVKEGSFVGAGAVVIPGITVGAHSIVGAGSTVISNVPDNSVFAGTPAKLKKQL